MADELDPKHGNQNEEMPGAGDDVRDRTDADEEFEDTEDDDSDDADEGDQEDVKE